MMPRTERVFHMSPEAILAIAYIQSGGSGVPLGPYAYRGNRSMVGRGVPERSAAELTAMDRIGSQSEEVCWPTLNKLETASAASIDRLGQFDFD